MTSDDARKLKELQKVRWTPDGTRGEVREVSYAAVRIRWDDGRHTLLPFEAAACLFRI